MQWRQHHPQMAKPSAHPAAPENSGELSFGPLLQRPGAEAGGSVGRIAGSGDGGNGSENMFFAGPKAAGSRDPPPTPTVVGAVPLPTPAAVADRMTRGGGSSAQLIRPGTPDSDHSMLGTSPETTTVEGSSLGGAGDSGGLPSSYGTDPMGTSPPYGSYNAMMYGSSPLLYGSSPLPWGEYGPSGFRLGGVKPPEPAQSALPPVGPTRFQTAQDLREMRGRGRGRRF